MAFDVSALSAYVQNNSREIAMKAIANSQTAKLLLANKAVQAGVKGKAAILAMDQDVVLQSGANCGRTPSGTITLSNKTIEAIPLASYVDICPKSLWNNYFNQFLAEGQSPKEEFSPEFAGKIMDERASLIAFENEKLIWRGNTSLTGSTNLAKMDGFVKQITGTTISATGSTIVEKLQTVWKNTPAEQREKEDWRIFISEDNYADYLIALANKNIYKPTDDKVVFGTTAKFEVVAGLNGVGKVYATRITNLRMAVDGTDDADKASFEFSNETKKYYVDFAYALGVAVVIDSEVGVASI
jgi:hypothetical protein